MLCPQCGADSAVGRTRPGHGGRRVLRQRVCTADPTHRFDTVEQVQVVGLGHVGVRRSGDDALGPGAFDWDRLVRDVGRGVLKFLDEAEILVVCTSVVKRLELDLPTILQPLGKEERQERPELVGWIRDSDVSDVVERRLRRGRSRPAHVMYALAVRGRQDRAGRTGLSNAESVLNWLFERQNYPELTQPVPRRAFKRPTDKWYPVAAAPEPRTVIKRSKPPARFLRPQLEASIRRAMLGRDVTDDTAELVAQWVLWGLAGQTEVHANQLAVGVLDCLRRVDDIAYLRWAAVAKNMTSVTQLRDEALSLVASPSARLMFDVSKRPRRDNKIRGTATLGE